MIHSCKVELLRRRNNLSHSHHREVAPLEPIEFSLRSENSTFQKGAE